MTEKSEKHICDKFVNEISHPACPIRKTKTEKIRAPEG